MDNPFVINLSGLKPGNHSFRFSVDDGLFERMPHSPIRQGRLEAAVDLDKRTDMLVLDISFEGTVHVSRSYGTTKDARTEARTHRA